MVDDLHGLWVKCHRTGRVGRIAYYDALGVHVMYSPIGSMGTKAKNLAGYCDMDELTFLNREKEPFYGDSNVGSSDQVSEV